MGTAAAVPVGRGRAVRGPPDRNRTALGASRQSHCPSGSVRPVKGAHCVRVASRWPSATLDSPARPGMPKTVGNPPKRRSGGARPPSHRETPGRGPGLAETPPFGRTVPNLHHTAFQSGQGSGQAPQIATRLPLGSAAADRPWLNTSRPRPRHSRPMRLRPACGWTQAAHGPGMLLTSRGCGPPVAGDKPPTLAIRVSPRAAAACLRLLVARRRRDQPGLRSGRPDSPHPPTKPSQSGQDWGGLEVPWASTCTK
ncbi:hypothetical protein EES41_16420 [Streptomyces sp. ADI95-16]|nr:hypothetical protein EES41_16420 [Streptomyces sp. ADI95-16]